MKTISMFLSFGILLIMFGCRTAAIEDVPPQPIMKNISKESVYNAIYRAGLKRGWIMHKVRDGLVEATYARRDFSVTINIIYTSNSYAIRYHDSRGLKYDENKHTIHSNYNNWIVRLKRQIDMELMREGSNKDTMVTTSVPHSTPLTVSEKPATDTTVQAAKNVTSTSEKSDEEW